MRRVASMAALLALTTCESAPVPAPDLCDSLADYYCLCEPEPYEACLALAATDEAAQACDGVVE